MQSYNNSNNAHSSFHIIQQLKKEDFTINVKLALQPPPLLQHWGLLIFQLEGALMSIPYML